VSYVLLAYYFLAVCIIGWSFIDYRFYIEPKLQFAKAAEKETLGLIMSRWVRVRLFVKENHLISVLNVGSGGAVVFGFLLSLIPNLPGGEGLVPLLVRPSPCSSYS
jgi:hypothetical protein